MSKLSEPVIAKTLWGSYGAGQWACANIHYYAFESDLLILRKSGTVIEYEIKLSVSDYKAGLKKKQVISPYNKNRRQNRISSHQKYTSRHEYLLAGMGANMFYYAAPDQVLDKVEIPEWAGIIRVAPNRAVGSCSKRLIRRAKSLHKEKAPDSMKEKMLTSCYYKYWRNYCVKDMEAAHE